MTRKILALALATIALVGLVAAGIGIAGGYSHINHIDYRDASLPTPTPPASPSPAPADAAYTIDATPANVPTAWPKSALLVKVHNIQVWMGTATCMKKAGYADFHYKIFWKIQAIGPHAEEFWLAGKTPAEKDKALTKEFGPTHMQGVGGCTREAQDVTPLG